MAEENYGISWLADRLKNSITGIVTTVSTTATAILGTAAMTFTKPDLADAATNAYAQESVVPVELPSYVRKYVKLVQKTPEINKLLKEYGFVEWENPKAKSGKSWTVIKKGLQGALYEEINIEQNEKFLETYTKAVKSVKEMAPQELKNAIQDDKSLSDDEKDAMLYKFAESVVIECAIAPAITETSKELNRWAQKQQVRMACPQKEDDVLGFVGYFGIDDPKDLKDGVAYLYSKFGDKFEWMGLNKHADDPLNHKLVNAEAMEMNAFMRKLDTNILDHSMSSYPVIAVKCLIGGELRLKHYQYDGRSKNPVLRCIDGRLQLLRNQVKWDRLTRVTIHTTVDGVENPSYEPGTERGFDKMYGVKGRYSSAVWKQVRQKNGAIEVVKEDEKLSSGEIKIVPSDALKWDPELLKRIKEKMGVNMGPRLRGSCSELEEDIGKAQKVSSVESVVTPKSKKKSMNIKEQRRLARQAAFAAPRTRTLELPDQIVQITVPGRGGRA